MSQSSTPTRPIQPRSPAIPPAIHAPSPLPSTLIDTAKALASQLIVAHHLVIYGPMSRQVRPIAPDLWAWLAGPARLAVQVFLVIAGYLAARALMPTPGAAGRVRAQGLPGVLGSRVLRLAPVYWLAIALVLATSAVARVWLDDPDTPLLPHATQLLANLLFLQDVTGHDALSAGLWYVAIDLQLYAGLAFFGAATGLLGGVSERSRALMVVLTMVALVAASLYGFNRLQGWDAWAPYFFGSYGLGVLAHWLGRMSQATWRGLGLAGLCVLVAGALAVDYRSRIALAGAIAVLLVASPAWLGRLRLDRQPMRALCAWLARLSYAVFLLHYPISLAVAALVTTLAPESLEINLLGLVGTWLLTLACAHALEQRIGQLQRRWRERRAEAAPAGLPVAG
ncbi:acyltransferase family protein [Leptothrix sp. BB-4]